MLRLLSGTAQDGFKKLFLFFCVQKTVFVSKAFLFFCFKTVFLKASQKNELLIHKYEYCEELKKQLVNSDKRIYGLTIDYEICIEGNSLRFPTEYYFFFSQLEIFYSQSSLLYSS